ncbi:RHS repeat protein [Desertifilum sp. FACHB-1129]|uniref:RHS repeat protein n=2 Tax=Desertifilum tharense IPPAS B-1220 TaxID=1781255 RepID=A0A1E5QL83_9CYAN|nr:RHS repeat domain-containing protein [Desertifilum tharense]MBD2313773.1 RHS repeat protein [Desertifilum sp. FACHB-1129]MBD2324516.1 RHS repeat protein [Desertifilum sp. FACHB-866]MBD2334530.1 RHS repeat protein [Desertifilum sp. FACHB-868]MDA0209959.1 RHS repeat protein [Cyanobacteria bacterium FC1]OEJ75435.1 hypothetical protein BH720_09315 [Desertifilum tharense IPPAS B-1220]
MDALSQLASAIPFGIASLHAPGQTLATIDWTGAIYPDRTPAFLTGNSRSQTEYYKNGLVKTEIDELRNRTEYRYDNSGRLVEVIYPDNTPNTLDDNPRTQSEYDKLGRTVATVDPLGRVTYYEYDNLG